jgi:hypothetical protein
VIAEINVELITIALASLAAGVAVGFLLSRIFSTPVKKSRSLSEELKQNRQSSVDYQHDVTDHFVKTSELLESLTDCYSGLHQHLADGAAKLVNLETSRKLVEAGSVQLELIMPEPAANGQLQVPRDYAPGHGVLSESYGYNEPEAESISEENTDSAITNIEPDLAAKSA